MFKKLGKRLKNLGNLSADHLQMQRAACSDALDALERCTRLMHSKDRQRVPLHHQCNTGKVSYKCDTLARIGFTWWCSHTVDCMHIQWKLSAFV